MESVQHTYRLHLTAEDQHRNPYSLIPFDVPHRVARLAVVYEFRSALEVGRVGKESGSVVDLGLFDPRGCDLFTAQGFRGWSGSARSEVTLTPTQATPGYLPGPLYPGTWHVLLGFSQIAPEGCDVTVQVTLTPGDQDGTSQAADGPLSVSVRVVRDGPDWYRGDLHCHTHHSDATAEVATLVDVARAQGLDFLAVTDHNTVSHFPELVQHSGPDLLLIPGTEITTHRGHANVWGGRTWLEFRVCTDEEIRRVREQARDQGALFSINHPKEGGPDWQFGTTAGADAVEGWQAPWWLSNHVSLGFWDRLLREGTRPTLVGGSDKHQGPYDGSLSLYELGTPTTWVYARSLSEEEILAGIRAGHVYVSQDPSGPRLEFTAQCGDEAVMMGDELRVPPEGIVSFRCRVVGAERGWLLRAIDMDGEAFHVAIAGADFSYAWQVDVKADNYLRVEVIEPPLAPLDEEPSALFVFAASNPIYVRCG